MSAQKTASLMPCRGCKPNCQHRKVCAGKPWRADAELKKAANALKKP